MEEIIKKLNENYWIDIVNTEKGWTVTLYSKTHLNYTRFHDTNLIDALKKAECKE